MSEYLLFQYRPVADGLLELHDLSVPESTQHLLATTIMHSRELTHDQTRRSHSPNPAKKKIETHARALLAYAEKPPARKNSVPKRCASLRKALLGSDLLALELGLVHAHHGTSFDFEALLNSLEAGQADPTVIAALLNTLARTPSGSWGKLGRPREQAKQIVRAGCIVWNRAGRTERYSWREDVGDPADKDAKGTLAGPLPDFLRDLIACCNGTHKLVAKLERGRRPEPPKGYPFEWPDIPGDGLILSDKSLQLAIMDCKNSGLI